jgi:hypothetical protein
MEQGFKYIYGPVSSWRLGSSLGIDLLKGRKDYTNRTRSSVDQLVLNG